MQGEVKIKTDNHWGKSKKNLLRKIIKVVSCEFKDSGIPDSKNM